MISTFRDKELARLWETGKSRIDANLHRRILVRLDRLDVVTRPEEMNLPGFNFHALTGFNPARYTVHVNARGVSRLNLPMARPGVLTWNNIIEGRLE
jgi:proteic killer suppression protein